MVDLQKYKKIFVTESEKYLKELDAFLMRVEQTPDDTVLWKEIHGKIHSIKGMAKALSMDHITQLSHAMEDWCKLFQKDAGSVEPGIIQFFFDGSKLLQFLVGRNDDIGGIENRKWYNALLARFGRKPSEQPQNSERIQTGPGGQVPEKIDQIRVKYSLIEELLGYAQETLFLEKTLPPLSRESTALKSWIDHYTSMLKGLYFRLAQLRLMSVGDFADLFVVTIRNLAREYDKQVEFRIVGGDLQADIALLDRLREPFIHLIRNSIAHGIETVEERQGAGKKPMGLIQLEADKERESLCIKIRDDGRGISREAITRHLKDSQLMSDEQIAALPEAEFFGTIFDTDFSSAAKASDIAGRGIGMNVVAQAIEYLSGSITIASDPARGTEFLIRLPVSLSVVYTITFKIGPYMLSIPTANVESIDQWGGSDSAEENELYDLGALLGVKQNKKLSHVMNVKYAENKNSIAPGQKQIRFAVDTIIGNKAVMVMPVGELLSKTRAFGGVGVMENGDITMLLDPGSRLFDACTDGDVL